MHKALNKNKNIANIAGLFISISALTVAAPATRSAKKGCFRKTPNIYARISPSPGQIAICPALNLVVLIAAHTRLKLTNAQVNRVRIKR